MTTAKTPSEIRQELLRFFYDMYMKDPDASIIYSWQETVETAKRLEVEWLVNQGWVDQAAHSFRLSVAGRDEYERQLVAKGMTCPTCGRS